MNNLSNINYYKKYINNINNVLYYKNKDKYLKSDNEIVSIDAKKFNKNEILVGKLKLFPVLTISNNCDIGRMQYSDSFLIITNNSTNENNNLIPNSDRNAILSSNNNNSIYGYNDILLSNNNAPKNNAPKNNLE